jgi:uncharacterized membrane protein
MKNVTPSASTTDESSERLIAGISYVLFLIGPTNGLTMLIAAVIAYMRKDQAPAWIASHYEFQLRTVIYALALLVIAIVCAVTIVLIPIAALIWLLWSLWVIIRVVVGIIRLVDGRANPDPTTFWV